MAKTKRGPGQPKKLLDWEQFDKLCHIQCTLVEIANWFDVSEDTVEARVKEEKGMLFREYQTAKSAGGKASLRRKQFEMAMGGINPQNKQYYRPNVTMMIWLGKQYLGQKDRREEEVKLDTKDFEKLEIHLGPEEVK